MTRYSESSTSGFVDYFRVNGNPQKESQFPQKRTPVGREVISQRARLLAKQSRESGKKNVQLDAKRYERADDLGGLDGTRFPNKGRRAGRGASRGSLRSGADRQRANPYPKRGKL